MSVLPNSGFRQSRRSHSAVCVIVLALSSVLMGCAFRESSSGNSASDELTVSAAVSLKGAFNELAELSQKRNGMKIHFNYGASGALQKQIEAGAPSDLFASAGTKQMNDLETRRLILPETRRDFARNVLVLIVPSRVSFVNSFSDLSHPAVKKIAVGNPRTVPAGIYTQQTLIRLGLIPENQAKLVFAEDVRQVLDYVLRDEVEAGFVYSSDALGAGAKVRVVAQAPDNSHDPILYPIAVVKESKRPDLARQFIDLVVSAEGQTILVKHGFAPVR